MSDLVRLTGLWKSQDKNGNTNLSGKLNPITRLQVMPNTFKKEGDNSPDYFLYIAPHKEKESPIKQASTDL